MPTFDDAIRRDRPLILDGGLATQLEADGHDISGNLWSAALLRSNPRAIVDAHKAFLEAGAECIISASYQASRQGFAALGLSADDADDLIRLSVDLARAAADEFLAAHADADGPLIAASVGPFGATLHDGSEYTGAYSVSAAELRAFHAERLAVLDDCGADVLACETIPNIVEAGVLAALLAETATPAWVTFACRDSEAISDGTPLREACELFSAHTQVRAVGINCSAPHLVCDLIGEARRAAPDKAIVVYPNSGESYCVADNSWSGDAAEGFDAVAWWRAGARIIGGCCRTGPRDIAGIRQQLAC